MDLKKDDTNKIEANIPMKSTAEVHDGDGDDDDVPTLSAYALEALKDFLANNAAVDGGNTVALPQEDWRLSQFWYSPATATAVADEVFYLLSSHFSDAVADISVACIACPTLFAYLKKMYPDISAQLLEFDKRFQQHGSDFTFYDYNLPEELPQAMEHTYRIIVADPPYLVRSEYKQLHSPLLQSLTLPIDIPFHWNFHATGLSEECLEKVAQTIAFLAHPEKVFVLLLTGFMHDFRKQINVLKNLSIVFIRNNINQWPHVFDAGAVQTERAAKLLGLRPCGFRPEHSSKLGNEFRLFTNYDPGERLGCWESQEE
ncbi:hypothetical protein KSS87_015262 [Heliosperma pusillum]|nr:hypothetical protein KSS87_015262 [Heliosperma pusillum]